jgi:hypothetical protein
MPGAPQDLHDGAPEHSFPNADETALDALDKIRSGQGQQGGAKELKKQLEEAEAKIADLQAVIADQAIAQHLEGKRSLRPA